MLTKDERTELIAFRQAVEEVGEAGWTTCMMYIKCRVRQITEGLPDQQVQFGKLCKLEDHQSFQKRSLT
jgi:hypothetical protein